jgi:hypothetical protein
MTPEDKINALVPERSIKAGIDNYPQEGADILMTALEGVKEGDQTEVVCNLIGQILADRDRDVRLLARELRTTLAAQPAPLADSALVELEALRQVFEKEFRLPLEGKRVIGDVEVVDADHFTIALIGTQDIDEVIGNYFAAACNALPGLLARLRAAEAPKWIAVGDGLPKPTIEGFHTTYNPVQIWRVDAKYVELGFYDTNKECWLDLQVETELHDVLCWQPLAVAPTVKGGQPRA